MVRTTLRLNDIWDEVTGEENIIKIKKSKEGIKFLLDTLEVITKEILIEAIKSAKDSGSTVVRREDIESGIKFVLGKRGE